MSERNPYILLKNEKETELLKSRTQALAQSSAAIEEALMRLGAVEYLIFWAGSHRYALDVRFAGEVHVEVYCEPLPYVPELIRGIANIRGEIMVLIDLSLLMGFEPQAKRSQYNVIPLHFNGRKLGIIVDEFEDLSSIPTKHILSEAAVPRHIQGMTISQIYIIQAQSLIYDERIYIVD
ncbi:hypothetical protein COW36_21770 [bacterium (Candidatus Blackallbacteria) CG17_big_fil_post_rev_8_21_14_2_50_48_46]|uniref:CheW-like domain-containing protein n=1 Tax=bacterium (Candidatus Blackallbacteria) CG17_big_fil_post_rev_8_21_14_2_50_48_46 TaxID=2014261 RepID=A0A2M7FZR5_9BACT|nr:MAG: hypothetical protein COW64_11090 [bacterium (Candidatus Blackallbacteria) CG18_big_fil_WC_8_21_14_2_50_49_26]PIW14398.1 MAG: hypothetical protein COW36_21770 [bacterium (Candidatus Blackallbacteria) CG17_big_fil_post_rev_8_21_14_2_50_48_46]PIW46905.1 MAG: hypothetical protein COW20_14185 [bacterium (Candidatus Blackallbacteria) CG13_big_fil_rev_8_21_14_2_50_49_14]